MGETISLQAHDQQLLLKRMIEENIRMAEAVKELSVLVRDQALHAVELDARIRKLEILNGK